MSGSLETKLEALRADYAQVVGEPFEHFFCPLLLEDTSAQLCRAHLTNQAFTNANRRWTVQRADVDNFFGAMFESSFVTLGRRSAIDDYLAGKSAGNSERPKLYVEGAEVGYYFPKLRVPPAHSEIVLTRESKQLRIAVKIAPDDVRITEKRDWQFVFEKDCRLEALVSLLKAAHLTLFEMLGYRYAFSAGGLFLGHTILGQFFKKNRNFDKSQVISNARTYFGQYANLVRPMLVSPETPDDTPEGRFLYVCEDPRTWALIVLVRTADAMHAVLVPVLESPEAGARLVRFLNDRGSLIRARPCLFDGHAFQASPVAQQFAWPEANFD